MTMPELWQAGYQEGTVEERNKLRVLVASMPHNAEPFCVRCELLANLLATLTNDEVPHKAQPAAATPAPVACCDDCGNPKAHPSPDGNWVVCDICEAHPHD